MISQSTAEIKLLSDSENGRPPYWNSVSDYNFDVCIVIGMSFYMSSKFRRDRKIGGGVITSYRFFKMAAIESEMYFHVQVW